MSRFAHQRRVFFFEEPEFHDGVPHIRERMCDRTGVRVCTPMLPQGMDKAGILSAQKRLLDELMSRHNVSAHVAWYYTPMAREFSRHLTPKVVVYDCMDELSAFAGAPPEMRLNEQDLFDRADLVFTGGVSLYESKRKQHHSVHAFPSGVDVAHFAKARTHRGEPEDQAQIPHPRIGFAGVIDERMDIDLLREVSAMNPGWHFVLIGPTCKIDPASLPQAANLHYLGMKPYSELPAYFSGWEIGMLPFALNESTRFISPTKTPEYLAAGMRVVSSAIRDVVHPYAELGLVEIFSGAAEFSAKVQGLLAEPSVDEFRARADAFLSRSSWNKTWSAMDRLIEGVAAAKSVQPAALASMKKALYV
jgi:UDP-galactopyranose mutase